MRSSASPFLLGVFSPLSAKVYILDIPQHTQSHPCNILTFCCFRSKFLFSSYLTTP